MTSQNREKIPHILALDIEFKISEDQHEKTMDVRLDIKKDEFTRLNQERVKANKPEITLDQVQRLIIKGKLEKNNDKYKFNFNCSDNEKEIALLVEPLIEVKVNKFQLNSTELLYYVPSFSECLKNKNYDKLVDNYFKVFRENSMKIRLGNDNYKKIKEKTNTYHMVFNTLLNELMYSLCFL